MPVPDRSILQGIARGERTALEAVGRHYAAPVFRYLVRLCGDVSLAEDLAQDVALQLWRHLPGKRFPNERALSSWVYTVATNAFRMHRRRRSTTEELPMEPEFDAPAGEDCDPLRAAEREDLARRVRQAVEALPPAEREAVLLRVYGDLRYQDIAATTGEPVGTVKWRISRAYAALRRMLRSDYQPTEDGDERVRADAPVAGPRDGAAGTLARATAPAVVPELFRAKSR